MKRKNVTLFVIAVSMIAVGAVALGWLKNHQRLGAPGVRTVPLPEAGEGDIRVLVDLPEEVPGYTSEIQEMQELVVDTLPPDTSYGQRIYRAEDGFEILVNVVLMGTDRTSIHKPQFCLVGSGWNIDSEELVPVSMALPRPYDLEVSRIDASKAGEYEGQRYDLRGVYVYWFVADEAITARHEDRMLSMARSMLTEGVLERWAYITCFAICPPGREEETFQRIQQFMTEAVPRFQLPAGSPTAVAVANP